MSKEVSDTWFPKLSQSHIELGGAKMVDYNKDAKGSSKIIRQIQDINLNHTYNL